MRGEFTTGSVSSAQESTQSQGALHVAQPIAKQQGQTRVARPPHRAQGQMIGSFRASMVTFLGPGWMPPITRPRSSVVEPKSYW